MVYRPAMVQVIQIDDPEDPRIAAYRHVRERDLVGRDQAFIIEGEVVLRAFAAAGRHGLSSVLLAEKRVEKLRPILADLPAAPVYVAGQAVLDAIVGFHIHRGILALGRRGPLPTARALLETAPPRALAMVLFGIGNHDNMGALFRNAAAFGVDAVLLDSTCCDPLYRKAIRVSVGATLTTAYAQFDRDDDPIDLLVSRGFECLALSPSGQATLADVRRSERMAVLLGAEGPGLEPGILKRARSIAIPMAGAFDSLNVATTCGIALHHLRFTRQPYAGGRAEPEP
jgi:tRNA G18 (ribose-2'-O)-methylase SpoU